MNDIREELNEIFDSVCDIEILRIYGNSKSDIEEIYSKFTKILASIEKIKERIEENSKK